LSYVGAEKKTPLNRARRLYQRDFSPARSNPQFGQNTPFPWIPKASFGITGKTVEKLLEGEGAQESTTCDTILLSSERKIFRHRNRPLRHDDRHTSSDADHRFRRLRTASLFHFSVLDTIHFMKHLWSPWRMKYITGHNPKADCFFCAAWSSAQDDDHWLVRRGEHAFVILNRYPYTCGHLMVAPIQHIASFEDLRTDILAEMMNLAQVAVRALRKAYGAGAFNIGLNLGEAAGAGVASHLHLHVVPRWAGDTNFMTTTGEVRVLPESLDDTLQKIRSAWH
jgi:ATP adenylyltransferase